MDTGQVFRLTEFTGGVWCQCQGQVIRGDAAAVVDNTYQFLAAFLQVHLDSPRPSVDGVLQQFLHHAGGPLNDLTGRYLIDHCRWQLANDSHGRPYPGCTV